MNFKEINIFMVTIFLLLNHYELKEKCYSYNVGSVLGLNVKTRCYEVKDDEETTIATTTTKNPNCLLEDPKKDSSNYASLFVRENYCGRIQRVWTESRYSCINLDNEFQGNILSLHVFKGCMQFWTEELCIGRSFNATSKDSINDNYSDLSRLYTVGTNHYWGNKIRSASICDYRGPLCDLPNVEYNSSNVVTLFTMPSYCGTSFLILLNSKYACKNLEDFKNRAWSAYVSRGCVLFYDQDNCNGESMKGEPHNNENYFADLAGAYTNNKNWKKRISSVSSCNYEKYEPNPISITTLTPITTTQFICKQDFEKYCVSNEDCCSGYCKGLKKNQDTKECASANTIGFIMASDGIYEASSATNLATAANGLTVTASGLKKIASLIGVNTVLGSSLLKASSGFQIAANDLNEPFVSLKPALSGLTLAAKGFEDAAGLVGLSKQSTNGLEASIYGLTKASEILAPISTVSTGLSMAAKGLKETSDNLKLDGSEKNPEKTTTTTELSTTTTEKSKSCKMFDQPQSVSKELNIEHLTNKNRHRRTTGPQSERFNDIMRSYGAQTTQPFFNNFDNPVNNYYFGRKGDCLIPLGAEAMIFPVAKNLKDKKDIFSGPIFDNQMNCLHAYGYGSNSIKPKDDKGHLIARRFGGKSDTENMVPQSPLLNRNFNIYSDGGWYQTESRIDKWISSKDFECPGVRLKIAVEYDFQAKSLRPTGFLIEAEYYKNILDETTKTTEIVYYSNEITCNIPANGFIRIE